MAHMGFQFTVSLSFSPGVGWATFSCGGLTKEESVSNLTQIVGRIQFLVIVGLRGLHLPAGCQLEATLRSKRFHSDPRGQLLFLKVVHIFLLHVLPPHWPLIDQADKENF